MRPNPKPQEIYRHFKGDIYQIRCLARHSETGETMVVYQAMYGTFPIYTRPLSMFLEEVDHVRYPDAEQRYRFERIQDMEACQPEQAHPEAAIPAEKPQGEEPSHRQAEPEPQTGESEEQFYIDPLVMEFLDADTYEQRLNILAALRHRITDDMINTMAAAVDLEIKDGNVEERYDELRGCLLTFEKYECNRLR